MKNGELAAEKVNEERKYLTHQCTQDDDIDTCEAVIYFYIANLGVVDMFLDTSQ